MVGNALVPAEVTGRRMSCVVLVAARLAICTAHGVKLVLPKLLYHLVLSVYASYFASSFLLGLQLAS